LERKDLALIKDVITNDDSLRALISEHEQLEHQLESLNRKSFLTPMEVVERKRLQKLKLMGRDRIEAILARHR
jgi:uncharacterized protein YdcH (DUF465 family)